MARSRIYTKFGDTGHTQLLGGVKVPKDDLRVRVNGGIDELNAVLGMVLAKGNIAELESQLRKFQSELFCIGAEVASPRGKTVPVALVEDFHVLSIENAIDTMAAQCPPLKNFVLPGGHPAAALLQFARAVCRRCERDLCSLNRAEPVRPVLLRYLNRLSDYFFICALFTNHRAGVPEIPWTHA